MDKAERSGGCMCRAVRITARGQPSWIAICHCASCRRHTGGVLNGAAGFPLSSVGFSGTPAVYRSSPGVSRYFCANCGTALAYQSEQWPEEVHLFIGMFDDPESLAPDFHIFAESRLRWLRLADHLPQYRTTPSAAELMPD